MAEEPDRPTHGLREYQWQTSYRTSSISGSGRPTDILREFYIPALQRSVHYDRVAGYFRSTSLAVASQGFSAFVAQEGRMRLIVGADLNADDVQAILDGDSGRLASLLNAELGHQESWPTDVQNGVDLLSWMVARGHLEVRVAFRVHASTREPMTFESVADGYVHEKWAVFRDAVDDGLYMTGSLNESKTALTINAENIDIHCGWWGRREQERLERASSDFEILWNDENPHLRVLTLPDAVRQRLVQFADSITLPREIDGSSGAEVVVVEPSSIERLKFALIADGPRLPGGRYVGIETAPVAPWPHQTIVARRLVETWPYNHLLCDEVGLGKTIEAGLAIRGLHLSGIAPRVLVAAPRSLTQQWQREMATKFLLRFGRARTGSPIRHDYVFPHHEEQPAASLYAPDLCIVSTGLLARKERLADLDGAADFDIALVDEAHYARRRNPNDGSKGNPEYGGVYRAIRDHLAPKTECLWLATATPMQLNAVEVSDLLRLTGRVGSFQFDPTLMAAYYDIVGSLVRGRPLTTEEWEFLRRAVDAVRREDPLLWGFVEDAVIDGRIRSSVSRWLDEGRTPRGPDLRRMLRVVFAVAPLSRVMLRHTRPLLEIYRDKGKLDATLATRHILPVPRIVMNEQERDAYDRLDSYCSELTKRIAENSHGSRMHLGFLLSFLRLRFASSLFSIRETLRRRRERVHETLNHLTETQVALDVDYETWLGAEEDEGDEEAVAAVLKNRTPGDLEWELRRLDGMLASMADIGGVSSKVHELLRVLDKRRITGTTRIEQTVVFTRFYDTLTDIVTRLRAVSPEMLIGTYSGQGGQFTDPGTHRLVGVDRERVKARFLRGDIDVLVCTDAAAEGLNLQTADLLINFDLPWNPMKVEQRIGRIDRIGQRHEAIYVLNLCYVDSAEQIVYDRLLTRLAAAGGVVGAQQISMLPVTLDDFQDLAEGRLTAEALEAKARETLQQLREQVQSREIPPDDVYEIYSRMAQSGEATAPVTLDTIWATLTESPFLRELGCAIGDNPSTIVVAGVAHVTSGSLLTCSRESYEAGAPDTGSAPNFASYGDPVFDAIVDEATSYDLPACVRRLSARIEGLGAELVGYAVAVNDGGTRAVRLVVSLRDVECIDVDEATELAAEDVVPVQAQLEDLARREFGPTLGVTNLEKMNAQAGHAQLALGCMIADELLSVQAITAGGNELFSQTIKDIERIVEQRESMNVANLPAGHMRRVHPTMLFPAKIPRMGDRASLTAPKLLLDAAVHAAHRAADAMNVRSSELRTDAVIRRLKREIEEEMVALNR